MTTEFKPAVSFSFPDFYAVKPYTRTVIVHTNLYLHLKVLFEHIDVTPYVVEIKQRGKKHTSDTRESANDSIRSGSIITLRYEDSIRGIDLSKKVKRKWFRNSITVVMVVDGKLINFKMCQNGVFQITGCRFREQGRHCVFSIWEIIKHDPRFFSFSYGTNFTALFIPAMRNIHFPIGFLIDREKLKSFLSMNTSYNAYMDVSYGYTGVNIKTRIVNDIMTLRVDKTVFQQDGSVEDTVVTYREYLDRLPPKERSKKEKKVRRVTFLVFQSGKIIVSGISGDFIKDIYYDFMNIITENKENIMEKLF